MTLLVTGATGDLGLRLLHDLAARGEPVRATTRNESPPPSSPAWSREHTVEWVRADLGDPAALRAACRGVRAVVHMAAMTHAPTASTYYSVNVGGTENLLAAAEQAKVELFVHISTRAIGAAAGAYGHSKLLAEERVRSSACAWVIVRPAEVYGTGGRDPVLSLARSLRHKSFVPILGDGSYGLCPVHVQDAVDAIVRAVDRKEARGGTYVLAGPEAVSYLELIERIEAMLALPRRRRIHIPVPIARFVFALTGRLGVGPYVSDQIPRLLAAKSTDSRLAIQDLDFRPRTLEVGLAPLLREPASDRAP